MGVATAIWFGATGVMFPSGASVLGCAAAIGVAGLTANVGVGVATPSGVSAAGAILGVSAGVVAAKAG